jgi:peptidoglycan LD-endopeptidase CwlK
VSALPAPPVEVPRDNSLACLAPKFRAKLALVLAEMQSEGYVPMVYETCRTNSRQRFLYGFGRDYDDGRGQVTRSINNEHTWHGFGLAADVICSEDGWDAPQDFWNSLDRACTKYGLSWGGDWPTMRDLPHVQWGQPMRRSPSTRAPQLRSEGGNEAVWKDVGAA